MKNIFSYILFSMSALAFALPPASAKDIFKTDTIEYGGTRITRIIRTGSGELSIAYNGGGLKSFQIALSDIAGESLQNLAKKKAQVRAALVALIYTSPKKGIERYVKDVLDDKNVWVRWDAINILLSLGTAEEDIMEKTKNFFSDPSPDIRIKVCRFYEKYASSSNARAIYTLLWDKDARVRLQALSSVSAKMSGKAAVSASKMMIKDADASVRAKAVEILFTKDAMKESEVDKLMLKDKSAKIRKAAADILFKKGTGKSVTSLVKALKDSDADVRASAKKALDRIRKKSDIPL